MIHQCYYKVMDDEDIQTKMQEWTETEYGRTAIIWLAKMFQAQLPSEALTFAVADILLLWTIDQSAEESGVFSSPPDLSYLNWILLEGCLPCSDHRLLWGLVTSLYNALDMYDLNLILEVLDQALSFDPRKCRIGGELEDYFVERLRPLDHKEAAKRVRKTVAMRS